MAPSRLALLLLSLVLSFAAAQVASETVTPATSVNATISAGDKHYTYYGCYAEPDANSTNGLRALNPGKMESRDDMTVATCLSYCADGGWAFAGLEYTKECWCAPLVTSLATKLDDSACDLACQGNTSERCGGSLRLSVYGQKSGSQGSGVKAVHQAPVGSILALGVAMGVLLCLA
ncbi:hypothetical protein B2J93_7733 [Marssonina coronariae]|uniref:WSC domain-containing protein n=1 Tax=Diplocarpon coronariae TaxID=2795749 RepID=A0A218ZG06_9HELO|nr:hypothetical protein JHW43_008265 [Diplocarpon mali]OWP06999.1 hypothetical protein B2J93_7733 [Marssonina coronariae]